MDKNEQRNMAQYLSDMAINNCDNAHWDKLEEFAKANWSVCPDTLIRMAIHQLFGLEY